MINLDQLRGKTIVITEAAKGIGKGTAVLLSRLGANLVLGSRNEYELEQVSAGLENESLIMPLDVTKETSVRRFADKAISRYGKIDALVNSAGSERFSSIMDLSIDDFDNMVCVNLRGSFLCCKFFGNHMLQQHEGKIINFAAVSSPAAFPGGGGYFASKFGLLGLTGVMQSELRDRGVQVMAVVRGVSAHHIVYLLCQPANAAATDEFDMILQGNLQF